MLLPGLVGLAVIESFAARTPVITVDWPHHSPEFSYLTHQENAVVVRRDATPNDYASAVADVLTSDRLDKLREGCAQSSATYSLDAMVTRFAEGIQHALVE
jgi:UDP-N-acetylglucosamine:LPS N-acetylglucosamine transferase